MKNTEIIETIKLLSGQLEKIDTKLTRIMVLLKNKKLNEIKGEK